MPDSQTQERRHTRIPTEQSVGLDDHLVNRIGGPTCCDILSQFETGSSRYRTEFWLGRACREYCIDDGNGRRGLTPYGVGSETEGALGVGTKTCYNKARLMLGMQMVQR
jgi:hypothetical protein